MVIVSGIQPSGNLHLGNYFGAVQQFIQFMEGGHECYYFLANYHALTSLRDGQRLLEPDAQHCRRLHCFRAGP